MDPLEACHMLLRLLEAMKAKDKPSDQYRACFIEAWSTVDDGLQIVAGRHYEHHPDMARSCLELIEALDILSPHCDDLGEQAFATWCDEFPESESWFPDSFLKALVQFLPADDVTASRRLRRLRRLRQHNEDTVHNPSSESGKGLLESIESARSSTEIKQEETKATTSPNLDLTPSDVGGRYRSDNHASTKSWESDGAVASVEAEGANSTISNHIDEVPTCPSTTTKNHDVTSFPRSPRSDIPASGMDPGKPPDDE
jgi:hypothetical protein